MRDVEGPALVDGAREVSSASANEDPEDPAARESFPNFLDFSTKKKVLNQLKSIHFFMLIVLTILVVHNFFDF